jgi:hypothetical protein
MAPPSVALKTNNSRRYINMPNKNINNQNMPHTFSVNQFRYSKLPSIIFSAGLLAVMTLCVSTLVQAVYDYATPFDTGGSNDWCNSSLQELLETDYRSTIATSSTYLTNSDECDSLVSLITASMWEQAKDEYKEAVASLDGDGGGSNYLPAGVSATWTTTADTNETSKISTINAASGDLVARTPNTYTGVQALPLIKLAQVEHCVSGDGTVDDPYILQAAQDCILPPANNSPSTSSSNNSGTSHSNPKETTCNDNTPVGIPDLFQIDRKGQEAILWFTPVRDNTNQYHVVYGHRDGEEKYGGLALHVNDEQNNGVQSITVRDLNPKLPYSFQVLPVNGCSVGERSNWLNAKPISIKTTVWAKEYRYFGR